MTKANSSNQNFITKLTEIILSNLGNENFDVNELAQAAGMTSSSLRRKLHAVSEKSINQLIREVRLQKAMEILQEEDVTASEVAYKVGFGSPAYFSKCFHDHFGYTPGEVKNNRLNGDEENSTGFQFSPEIKQENKSKLSKEPKSGRRKIIIFSASIILILFVMIFLYNRLSIKNDNTFSISHLKTADKSIAVLPFKNLSNDEENQYFADGVMEDILKLIYKVGEFSPVSRTSVEQYRGSTKTISEIARELSVNFILEGSVQRYKDRVRINVRLIYARHDRPIFNENYDREFADIFEIQSSIAKQVADQLEAVLSPNEMEEIDKIPTRNTEAYNLYLKGRFFWNKRTEEGVNKSIGYFERAVETDPNYAQAWVGLADGYSIQAGYGWSSSKKEGVAMSKVYIQKALELDKNLAEAHAVLGRIFVYNDRIWEEGEKELILAIRLNPNHAPAHQYYSQLLDILGDYKKAREQIDLALELDPLAPIMHRISATLYYNEGNFNKSLKECREVLSIEKNFKSAHWRIFFCYYRLGDGDKALDKLQEILRLYNLEAALGNVADSIYAKSGLDGIIEWIIDITPNQPWLNRVDLAKLNAIIGKKEEALTCLEKYIQNSPGDGLVRLINSLDYETLRSEPRFKAVVDSLGLSEYYLKRMEQPGYITNQ